MQMFRESRNKRGIIKVGAVVGAALIFMNVSAEPISARYTPAKTAKLETEMNVSDANMTVITPKGNSINNSDYVKTVANLEKSIELHNQKIILNGDAAEAILVCKRFYTAEDFDALGLMKVKVQAKANLYLNADETSAVIAAFEDTDSVNLLFSCGESNFYYVEYNDLYRGYVKAEDIDTSTLSASQLEQVTMVNRSRFGAMAEQDVYLWSQPIGIGEMAAVVEGGLPMEILGVQEDWLQVNAAGVCGYVHADEVQIGRMLEMETDSEGYIKSARAEKELQEQLAAEEAARAAEEAAAQEAASEEAVYEEDSAYEAPDVPSSGSAVPSDIGQAMVSTAMNYLGVPYVYGGSSPSGFDCSGLVYFCAMQNGRSIPRCADAQYYAGGTYVSFDNLAVGDLVFFSADWSCGIEHVGIYVGGGQFIHAPSTGDVVKISSLSDYYLRNYWGALRLS